MSFTDWHIRGNCPQLWRKSTVTPERPLLATAAATALVLVLALALPLHNLAEVTARLTLIVFAIVNISLIVIKRRDVSFRSAGYATPLWVPWAGAVTCILLLSLDIWNVLRS